ncbi:MAG: hypothetical protein ABSG31_10705 [Tepidisphaeraceae bacterium]|jgi:hypothetical protein
MPNQNSHGLMDRIVRWLALRPGKTAVHAGHFLLLKHQDRCVPAILEEHGEEYPEVRGLIENLIARFPLETWRLGVELTARLNADGHDPSLLTLVNDWYFLRQLAEGEATELRKRFYASHLDLLPTYARALENAGLNQSILTSIGPNPVLISEYWLRRRAERRLKELRHPQVRSVSRPDGTKELMLEDLGRECRRLLCGGQADCADEVLELLCILAEKGFTSLINFIPRECEQPVNKGCVLAIDLFGLHDFRILNIALPCLGGGFHEQLIVDDAMVHTVAAFELDNGDFEADVNSAHGRQWIMT